jgi:hypothetical protein
MHKCKRDQRPTEIHVLCHGSGIWLTNLCFLEERDGGHLANMAAGASQETARAGEATKKIRPLREKRSPPKSRIGEDKAAFLAFPTYQCPKMV